MGIKPVFKGDVKSELEERNGDSGSFCISTEK